MGQRTATADLSNGKSYVFTSSSGATARWSNDQIFSAFDNIPAMGSKITSARASFQVIRQVGAIFKEWSIADEDGNNNATILSSGTSASTNYGTHSVDLLAKGIAASVMPETGYFIKFNRGYIRYKGEVKTVSGQFKDCKIVINWNELTKTYSLRASTDGIISTSGGTVETVSEKAYEGASISGTTATVPYYNSAVFIKIKATPKTGYRFVEWRNTDGKLFSTKQEAQFNIAGGENRINYTYTAVFEKLTYAITASAGAGGTISPSGSIQVGHGDSKTYTITPNDGYEIESVTVDGVNKGAVSSFTFLNVTAAHTISVTFKQIPTYYLDLNGMLDGVSSGGISPYGTADVYINGVLASDDCGDFWSAYPAGTTYEIKDIKAKDGYQYDGIYSGSLSGTITATTSVVLRFSTVAKPPEFTSASLIYSGSQVSAGNKVPAGESCILSVGVA